MDAPPSRTVAIYPGSFDPITNGHLDLISRGSKLVDRLIVAILHNSAKQSLFSVAERREMLEEAAKEQVDTIFTFVYGKGDDDEFVKDIIRRVESHAGRVLFVRLYCSRGELTRRVAIKSRKKQGKLASKRDLDTLFRTFDLASDVPFAESLSIETTHDSPRRVARSIAGHYGLVKPRDRANGQK